MSRARIAAGARRRRGHLTKDEMPNLIGKLKRAAHANYLDAVYSDDLGGLMLHIGQPGKSARSLPYNPVPSGPARLPKAITDLSDRYHNGLTKAIQNGAPTPAAAQLRDRCASTCEPAGSKPPEPV
jgi:hypothetical protein